MVFDLFRGSDESQIELIEKQIQEMLASCSSTFAMAVDAVMNRVPASEVGSSLRKSDRSVNRKERSIRRELLIHLGVRGSGADTPLILTYMSIIKDIERVGDNAKNLWDLAVDGVDFSNGSDSTHFEKKFVETAALITETARIFQEKDAKTAASLLPEIDSRQDLMDELIDGWVVSSEPSHVGVPRALALRYMKRITAHLGNVLTALVMPFDRLDYWDEDKADRTE